MRKKKILVELSTQLEDYTKVHAKVLHPQAQHKDNLLHF
jgi:hypothetical protein